MTRAEIRRQRERVIRALAWIQKRLETTFDLHVVVNEKTSKFATGRSGRGHDDVLCFVVEFNPEAVAQTCRKELRYDCLHEVFHCIWWNSWELAFQGRGAKYSELLRASMENSFYQFERSVGPWIVR